MPMPREDIGPTRLEEIIEKLSDKGAKDFKKGMGSMEKTSKMGGFINFKGMLLQMIAASPAMEMFKNVLEIFTNEIFAQIDWESLQDILNLIMPLIREMAAVIGEELNDALELATESAEALADALNDANIGLNEVADSSEVWDFILREMLPVINESLRGLTIQKIRIEENTVAMDNNNLAIGNLNLGLLDFQDIINNFSFPSPPGGGGGGGGDDDFDWDPWDLF